MKFNERIAPPAHTGPAIPPPRQRLVNIHLLVGTGGLLVVFGIGAFLWHMHQMNRLSSTLLAAADHSEKIENWGQAAHFLRCYLKLRPGTAEVHARLAQAMDKGSQSFDDRRLAMNLYAEAIARLPRRSDLRARLAEMQAATHPHNALETADQALAIDAGDKLALRVRAQILDQLYEASPDKLMDMVKAYSLAAIADPGNTQVTLRLATLCRDNAEVLAAAVDNDADPATAEGWQHRADSFIDELTANSPDRVNAHLIRYAYRRRYGIVPPPSATDDKDANAQKIDPDLKVALELGAENVNVRLAIAEAILNVPLTQAVLPEIAVGRVAPTTLDEVEQHLRAAKQAAPADPRPILGLAAIATFRGKRDCAIELLQAADRQSASPNAALLCRLAELMLNVGKWQSCQAVLDRLDQRLREMHTQPTEPRQLAQLDTIAKLLRARWHLDPLNSKPDITAATQLLREASLEYFPAPMVAAAECQRGACHALLCEWDSAISAFQKAAAIAPDWTPPRLGLASVFVRTGRSEEAWNQLQKLPDEVLREPAILGTAVALAVRRRDVQRAIELTRQAIVLNPNRGDLRIIRGRALMASRRPIDHYAAETAFLSAVRMAPGQVVPRLALAHFYLNTDMPDTTPKALAALQSVWAAVSPDNASLSTTQRDKLLNLCRQIHGETHERTSALRSRWEVNDPVLRRTFGTILAASSTAEDQTLGERLLDGDDRLRAIARIARGGPENRKSGIDTLARVEPKSAGDHYVLATMYRWQGDDKLARQHFRALLRQSPGIAEIADLIDLEVGEGVIAGMARVASQLAQRQPIRPAADQKLDGAVEREYAGEPTQAIQMTRQALAERPDDAILLNNLAWFMSAYQNDHAEALKLIDRAMSRVGPTSAVLDTRGVILLGAGRTTLAVRMLETAANGSNVPAATYLHLAEAYQKAGWPDASRQALALARKRGLDRLPPRDQATLRTLAKSE